MNEADTCRTYILPKLKSAGWEDERITEQMVLTPGRIVAYLDSVQARLASLGQLQSETRKELGALLLSAPVMSLLKQEYQWNSP